MRRALAVSAFSALLLTVAAAPAAHAAPPAPAAPAAAPPRLATLPVPGPRAFAAVARDVIDAVFAMDPSYASGAGLFDDAVRVPSYTPAATAALHRRLTGDLAKLRRLHSMGGQKWDVDLQIDARWIFAQAELVDHVMTVEKLYERRPGQWLEPTANNLIALESYAPDRPELVTAVLDKVPGMIAEMRGLLTQPTKRDLETGIRLAAALETTARAHGHTAAAEALAAWQADAAKLTPAAEFGVVGADTYTWRYAHAMLLPWSPDELLAKAQAELTRVDAEIATIPAPSPPTPTETQLVRARALDQASLLALYDSIEAANREATIRGGWVTIPDAAGPIRSRPTPAAMIPLTGDGGSMNPPPTYATSTIGWWNVEHFDSAMTETDRVETIVGSENFLENGMGTYSAHEGWPGHHLQLSVARLNPDPIRSILPDCTQNEGWALYAEQAFSEHGGLGHSDGARRTLLGSYRARIARVVYDVNIERGTWTLQQAADFKYRKPPGEGHVDEDLLRSINWPTQLVCYYAGKQQILELKAEAQAKLGPAFDERVFHDTLLQAGSIPYALVHAKVLGEAVPSWPED